MNWVGQAALFIILNYNFILTKFGFLHDNFILNFILLETFLSATVKISRKKIY